MVAATGEPSQARDPGFVFVSKKYYEGFLVMLFFDCSNVRALTRPRDKGSQLNRSLRLQLAQMLEMKLPIPQSSMTRNGSGMYEATRTMILARALRPLRLRGPGARSERDAKQSCSAKPGLLL